MKAMNETIAYLGVGSNLGAERNILTAAQELDRHVRVLAASTFYWTQPLGGRAQARFLNGALAIATALEPDVLKQSVLQPIEAALGRVRTADPNASRTIDLDLLVYGERHVSGGPLELPDPKIEKYCFVAVPLLDLAPGLILPGSNVPLAQIVARQAATEMEPAGEFTRRLRTMVMRMQVRRSEESADEQGPSC